MTRALVTVKGTKREARVLVVEDNPTNQAVAMAQLAKLGYGASVVANGAEAISALARETYDLVLMDCEMPIMDGYEATRLIRRSRHAHVPIIAVTAHAMLGDQAKSLGEGMIDFLPKPIDIEQLAAILAKWLPGSRPAAGRAANEAPPLAPRIFDSAALLKRLMGDRQLAGKVVHGFVLDVPLQLNRLQEHVARADAVSARIQAHALRGSAATVSALRLHAVAHEMEIMASAGDLGPLSELLARARAELAVLVRNLQSDGWLETSKRGN